MMPMPEKTETLPSANTVFPFRKLTEGSYSVKLVENPLELDAVLKLRFEVFNLELKEGLDTSYTGGRDRDAFDDICDHLMIMNEQTKKIVGTYRMLTKEKVGSVNHFYSSSEFDLSGLPNEVIENGVELGRACIAKDDRNCVFPRRDQYARRKGSSF